MKKILCALLAICFAISFTACGDGLGKNYWEDVADMAQELFESDDFKAVKNITFSENLVIIMNSGYGAEYSELKDIYRPSFTYSISYAYNQYWKLELAIDEKIDSEFRHLVTSFKKSLDNFEEEIKDFIRIKANYERTIDFTDEATATSKLQTTKLLKFKNEYIKLIESAVDVSYNAFMAIKYGGNDFSDYDNENVEITNAEYDIALAINASNFAVLDAVNTIIKKFNAENIIISKDPYFIETNNFYSNIIRVFENGAELTDEPKTQLKLWKGAYDLFVEDVTLLKEILNHLDLQLLKRCNNNANEYANATEDPTDEEKVNYFLNFNNKIEYLQKYCLKLFN